MVKSWNSAGFFCLIKIIIPKVNKPMSLAKREKSLLVKLKSSIVGLFYLLTFETNLIIIDNITNTLINK